MAIKRYYNADVRNGGTAGAMDAIEYATLEDGDSCFVVDSTMTFVLYRWDSSSTATEDGTTVIRADDDLGGNGRWLRVTDFEVDSILFNGMGLTAVGNRWGIIPHVDVAGVMEVGQYIDFHRSDADTDDYSVRLNASSANLVKFEGFGGFDAHITCGDITTSREDTTGVIYLGDQSGGARYLYYNGTYYVIQGADLYVNGIRVPTHFYSTGTPSGGVDGDVWFRYV